MSDTIKLDKTIEYVLEVADCGGIAKAAQNLYITPSALSKFIILKEKELGVKLFIREGNKFSVTYAGERYIEMLKELREKENHMNLEMRRLSDMYHGRLRVGFQMSIAEKMIVDIMPGLGEAFPNIGITLEEVNSAELCNMLIANKIDIGLSFSETHSQELHYREILSTPIVVVASKDSDLSRKAQQREGFSNGWLSDEIIAKQKFIIDEGARSFKKYAPRFISEEVIARSRVTVSNARTALMCVERGLGIIIIPEMIVRYLHFEDKVNVYSFGNEERISELSVITNPKSVLQDEINQFYSIACEKIR